MPEAFEIAELYGGDSHEIDRWRVNLLPSVNHFLNEIFFKDPEGNSKYISLKRLYNRFKHLSEFNDLLPSFREAYSNAQAVGHPLAEYPLDEIFPI